MIPYFFETANRIISQDLSEKLIEISFNNLEKFISYKSKLTPGLVDGNNFLYGPLLDSLDEIKKITNSCSLSCFPMIIMHKPMVKVIKHRDDPNKRNTVLSTPLFPNKEYVSTNFWEKDQNGVATLLAAVCVFTNNNSVFLNTNKIHNLENNDNYRLNLQFCFDEPFEHVTELYKENKLFNL